MTRPYHPRLVSPEERAARAPRTVPVICVGCGRTFDAVNRWSQTARYCSRSCGALHRPKCNPKKVPGIAVSPTLPHHHPPEAKHADGCVHHWTIDDWGHATCQKCPAEKDFSTLHRTYRGLFNSRRYQEAERDATG